ncbi:MAG: hypothetical protein ACE5E0_03615 [Terriglobia bacterium]
MRQILGGFQNLKFGDKAALAALILVLLLTGYFATRSFLAKSRPEPRVKGVKATKPDKKKGVVSKRTEGDPGSITEDEVEPGVETAGAGPGPEVETAPVESSADQADGSSTTSGGAGSSKSPQGVPAVDVPESSREPSRPPNGRPAASEAAPKIVAIPVVKRTPGGATAPMPMPTFVGVPELIGVEPADDDDGGRTEPVGPDVTGPQLTVLLTPGVLDPDGRKWVPVKAVVSVSDDRDPSPDVVLVSVTSRELDDDEDDDEKSKGVRKASPGKKDLNFILRAKKGRLYRATYEATDRAGNRSRASGNVIVPEDDEPRTFITL